MVSPHRVAAAAMSAFLGDWLAVRHDRSDLPRRAESANSERARVASMASRAPKSLRVKSNFASRFKLIWPVQSCAQKESAFLSASFAFSLVLS
jgi:hypothetical protein